MAHKTLLALCLISFICSRCYAAKKIVKEKHVHVREDVSFTSSDPGHYVLEIEHAIGVGSEFTRRGTVQLRNPKSSSRVFHQEPFTPEQLSKLKATALSGGKYFIRSRSNITEEILEDNELSGVGDGKYVQTFISACSLWKAKLTDSIVVHGDGKGNIIGLMLLPSVSVDGHCTESNIPPSVKSSFTTSLLYTVGQSGPVPDTEQYLHKIELEKAKKEGEDNRSFLQKYWMYILIGFVALQLLGPMLGSQ